MPTIGNYSDAYMGMSCKMACSTSRGGMPLQIHHNNSSYKFAEYNITCLVGPKPETVKLKPHLRSCLCSSVAPAKVLAPLSASRRGAPGNRDTIGALIITYTIVGVPHYDYSIIYPQTNSLMGFSVAGL